MPEVKPPVIHWKSLKHYDLSQLKQDFQIADFERRQAKKQVEDILDAILKNKFYDTVIRVVKVKKRMVVIDSQHRLQALYLAWKEHGVKFYDLMLAIYTKDDAMTIYRRLNLGKRLLPKDHTKALDDGEIVFFNSLRGVCKHDKDNRFMSFVEIMNALNYTKLDEHKALQPGNFDDFLKLITREDITAVKTCLESLKRFKRGTAGTLFYQALIFRNLIKLTKEENLTSDQIYELVEKLIKNDELLVLSTERKLNLLPDAYKIIKNLL